MYVKKISLKNFQTIESFEGEFSGSVYFVTGENELGKSTLLKSIGILLNGKRDNVLKNGKEKGFAEIIVGDNKEEYQVKLSFTKANPKGTLTITSKQTGMKSSNVSMLQDIFGYQDFDADEFARLSDNAEGRRKQIEIVKSLFPKEVLNELAELDKRIERAKSERKNFNDRIKVLEPLKNKAEKDISGLKIEEYKEEKDINELAERQNKFYALKAKYDKALAVVESSKQYISNGHATDLANINEAAKKKENDISIEAGNVDIWEKKKIEEIKKEAEERRKKLRIMSKEVSDTLQANINAINERLDKETQLLNKAESFIEAYKKANVKDLAEEMSTISDYNKNVLKVKTFLNTKHDLSLAEASAEEKQQEIDSCLSKKESLIKASKLPIKGLSFDNDGLILNGVPFQKDKVSDSQIMEVAIKLVMAKNSKVRVFRVARGESLGAAKLKNIVSLAKKIGFQGFIETVVRDQNDLRIEEYNEE